MQQVVDPTTGQAVAALNELEFVHGEVLANIWFTDRCVPILNPIVKQVFFFFVQINQHLL